MTNCRDCRFWKPPTGSYADGECRRHTPQLDAYRGVWPETSPDDWCGEAEEVYP